MDNRQGSGGGGNLPKMKESREGSVLRLRRAMTEEMSRSWRESKAQNRQESAQSPNLVDWWGSC